MSDRLHRSYFERGLAVALQFAQRHDLGAAVFAKVFFVQRRPVAERRGTTPLPGSRTSQMNLEPFAATT